MLTRPPACPAARRDPGRAARDASGALPPGGAAGAAGGGAGRQKGAGQGPAGRGPRGPWCVRTYEIRTSFVRTCICIYIHKYILYIYMYMYMYICICIYHGHCDLRSLLHELSSYLTWVRTYCMLAHTHTLHTSIRRWTGRGSRSASRSRRRVESSVDSLLNINLIMWK